MTYIAQVRVVFEIEFEDNGEDNIDDQAHDAGMDLLSIEVINKMLDFELSDVVEKSE